MKKYRPSKYNIYTSNGKGLLLYNTYSGAFIFIEDKIKNEVHNLINSQIIKITDENEHLVNSLIEGGFLVEENFDEIGELNKFYQKNKINEGYLSLTLLSSEKCNFSCPYCFIYHRRPIIMEENIYNAILKLVEKRIKNLNHIKIQFFGGEPLLNHQKNIRFLGEVNKIISKKSIAREFGIVTNGYLLDEKVFKDYLNNGVRFFQVTIDGSRNYHNSTRFTKDDKNTFSTILNNIIKCKEVDNNFNFVIRVNFQENDNSIDDLISFLKENFYEDKRFNIVFRPVMDFKTRKISDNIKLCSDNTAKSLQIDFLLKYYSNKIISFDEHMVFLPKRIPSWCEVGMLNSYIIGGDGLVFKCDVEIGDERFAIGKIDYDGNITINQSHPYIWYDPYSDDKCIKCNLLPICQGGCLRSRKNESNCYYNVDLIKEMMIKFHDLLKQR